MHEDLSAFKFICVCVCVCVCVCARAHMHAFYGGAIVLVRLDN